MVLRETTNHPETIYFWAPCEVNNTYAYDLGYSCWALSLAAESMSG